MDWNAPIPPERGIVFVVSFLTSFAVALVLRFTVARPHRCTPSVTPEHIVVTWHRGAWLPLIIFVCGSSVGVPMFFDPGLPRLIACLLVWLPMLVLAGAVQREHREEFRAGSSQLDRIAPSGRRTSLRWQDVKTVDYRYLAGRIPYIAVEAPGRQSALLRISPFIDGAGDLARFILAYTPHSASISQAAVELMERLVREADAEREKRGESPPVIIAELARTSRRVLPSRTVRSSPGPAEVMGRGERPVR